MPATAAARMTRPAVDESADAVCRAASAEVTRIPAALRLASDTTLAPASTWDTTKALAARDEAKPCAEAR
jgi:hypothetical protein